MRENNQVRKTKEELLSELENINGKLFSYFLKIKEDQENIYNCPNDEWIINSSIHKNLNNFVFWIQKYFDFLSPHRENLYLKKLIKEETTFFKKINEIYKITSSITEWKWCFYSINSDNSEKKNLCLKEIQNTTIESFEKDLKKIFDAYKNFNKQIYNNLLFMTIVKKTKSNWDQNDEIFSHKKERSVFLTSNKYKTMTLSDKIKWSKERIKEFVLYIKKNCAKDTIPTLSFSGGKDSCVIKDLVEKTFKELKIPYQFNIITSFEIFHPDTLKFINEEKEKWYNNPIVKNNIKNKRGGIDLYSSQRKTS